MFTRTLLLAALAAWIGLAPLAPHAADSAAPKANDTARQRKSETAQTTAAPETDPLDLILLERKSRALTPLEPVPDEASITSLSARILSRQHYDRRPLNDEVSSQFLDHYIDSLDPLRIHFLQADLQEFEKYRSRLDDLTKSGDIRPAREIFQRYMERLEQRMVYAHELLKTDPFDFTGEDRYNVNRRQAPWPKDLDAAHDLWRQHLRYEVLQEKLNWKEKKPAAGKTTSAAPAAKEPPATFPPRPGLHPEILQNISRRYARTLRAWREVDSSDVLQIYLTALTRVYDPHSDYLGKSTLENFAMSMSLSLFGIGAVLQSEDGYCKIRELKPGPAMRSKKMNPGDRVVAVAQGDEEPVDVVDMKLNKVVEMIRGPKGTKVRLTIIPVDAADPSERVEVALIRDEIKLEDEEAKAKVVDLPGSGGAVSRVGVIDLPSFYANFDVGSRNGKSSHKSTTEDVARLIGKLQKEGVQGLILDLRRNGGGSLEEAINLTGLFIKEGPVVQVRDTAGKIFVDEDPDPEVLYDGPLVVLTSRFSASASEILAGALQDYGRALIVGDSSTHGKGTVQTLIQLEPWLSMLSSGSTNNPGALKLTVRKFYRASGSSTQLKGVTPDIVLPSLNNYAEVGEAHLDNPMPWDTVPSAKFERVNRIEPVLAQLKERSLQRVAKDRDFSYLQEDIEIYKKYLADKTISLNEQLRRKEKQENEDRVETRKKERLARKDPEEKVYELTLKDVALPGLPAPGPRTNTVATTESEKVITETDDGEDLPSTDKLPPLDITLKEAKRILMDLIELSGKAPTVARRD